MGFLENGRWWDLPDRDTRLSYTHITKQHNFVVVNILPSVIIQGGLDGCVLVVAGCCHFLWMVVV